MPDDLDKSGYLHFYRTTHDLKLLLVDGMSAGKTAKGTMDSQDYILRSMNTTDSPESRAFDDYDRAAALCNMTRDEWHSKVDGFIRMEGGFEIILCKFEDHLDLVRAQQVELSERRGGMSDFRIYEAISDRFDGIGGGRVHVNYDSMISAFTYDGLDGLFVNSTSVKGEQLPRLVNQNQVVLRQIKDDITSMIMSSKPMENIDWQAVAEMFVQRYSASLQYLASEDLSPGEIKHELESLLGPFITDGADVELASTRCAGQIMPGDQWRSSTGQALQQVAHRVCRTLVSILFDLKQHRDEDIESQITELVTWLGWPIWRQCSAGCAYDERCILPIWGMVDSVKYRKQPQCLNATAFEAIRDGRPPGHDEDGYWRD